ncbi:uncharacterized protein LOC131614992 [Vicia villosa]|uniref:uncharacterized protein LOC131614992 n=1 Tax=Vicia villosa TaxID=3911 RepID=UPI00273CECBF|nr:uncharacterized protein LOC131614992 [Vicia villosa]
MIYSKNGSKAAPRLSLSDFSILKKFHISIPPLKCPRLVEVIWKPPPWNWIKANCDGASSHNLGNSAYEGLFRDHNGNFVGAFSHFLSVSNSLIADLSGVMLAIEFANEKNWTHLWLEFDSTAVIKAFNPPIGCLGIFEPDGLIVLI